MSNDYQTALDAARSLYSDLHKEARGVRPRDFAHLSLVEIDRRIQALDCEILDRREDEDPEAWKQYVTTFPVLCCECGASMGSTECEITATSPVDCQDCRQEYFGSL